MTRGSNVGSSTSPRLALRFFPTLEKGDPLFWHDVALHHRSPPHRCENVFECWPNMFLGGSCTGIFSSSAFSRPSSGQRTRAAETCGSSSTCCGGSGPQRKV